MRRSETFLLHNFKITYDLKNGWNMNVLFTYISFSNYYSLTFYKRGLSYCMLEQSILFTLAFVKSCPIFGSFKRRTHQANFKALAVTKTESVSGTKSCAWTHQIGWNENERSVSLWEDVFIHTRSWQYLYLLFHNRNWMQHTYKAASMYIFTVLLAQHRGICSCRYICLLIYLVSKYFICDEMTCDIFVFPHDLCYLLSFVTTLLFVANQSVVFHRRLMLILYAESDKLSLMWARRDMHT